MEVKKVVVDYICEYVRARRDCAISVLGNDKSMIFIYKDMTQASLDDAVDDVKKLKDEKADRELIRPQVVKFLESIGNDIPIITIDDDVIIIAYGKQFKIEYVDPKCFVKVDKLLSHLIEFESLFDCELT